MSVTRTGTDIVVRWILNTSNGKNTKVYFRRDDTGTRVVLTSTSLAQTVNEYTIDSQSLASPLGSIELTQILSNGTGETNNLNARVPRAGRIMAIIGDPVEGDPGPTPHVNRFADAFHHRDHLGSLRVVTDGAGWKQDAFDYYPYGRQMVPYGTSEIGSTSFRFAGLERDGALGLDYARARYKGTNDGMFASPDPIVFTATGSPNMLNRYSYVHGRSMSATDPSGLRDIPDCGDGAGGFDVECAGGGWSGYSWGGGWGNFGGGSFIHRYWTGNSVVSLDAFINMFTWQNGVFQGAWVANGVDATKQPKKEGAPGTQSTTSDECYWDYAGPPSPGDCGGVDTYPLRTPDFYNLSLNVSPWPPPWTIFGLTPLSLTIDRYNNWYVGAGGQAGKSFFVVGGSVSAGWLPQFSMPTSSELYGVLSGWSVGPQFGGLPMATGPFGAGGYFNSNGSALTFGVMTPTAGVGGTWSLGTDHGGGRWW